MEPLAEKLRKDRKTQAVSPKDARGYFFTASDARGSVEFRGINKCFLSHNREGMAFCAEKQLGRVALRTLDIVGP